MFTAPIKYCKVIVKCIRSEAQQFLKVLDNHKIIFFRFQNDVHEHMYSICDGQYYAWR